MYTLVPRPTIFSPVLYSQVFVPVFMLCVLAYRSSFTLCAMASIAMSINAAARKTVTRRFIFRALSLSVDCAGKEFRLVWTLVCQRLVLRDNCGAPGRGSAMNSFREERFGGLNPL